MLNLFRFHLKNGKCEGKHKPRTATYQAEENRPRHKKCYCPIWASGTLDQFDRMSCGTTDWDEARAWAAVRESANTWGVEGVPVVHVVKVAETEALSVTVASAIEQFLVPYRKHAQPATLDNYTTVLGKLQKFATDKGIAAIKNVRATDVRELRDSWDVKRSSMKSYMQMLRCFFRFCEESEWTDRNPARIKLPGGMRSAEERTNDQKHPFADAEVERMVAACARYDATGPVQNNRRWGGVDLADYILVSIHTGLRISDMTKFNIERLDDSNRCHIRTSKNGKPVQHKLPAWLCARMRARVARFGAYIFGQPTSTRPGVHTAPWRNRLNDLWELCGPWEHKPTPHRLRHTFARILLQTEGISIRDVAELMGDTEATVLKHYAAWVPERQARLDAAMDAAFADSKPPTYLLPKLVA